MSRIAYGQCWEDADVLVDGLDVQPGDRCLSICSAGDNALALLARDPERVIAVDLCRAQIACLELRVAGYACLAHEEFLELYGSRPSARRQELYRRCRPELGRAARSFWDARGALIGAGLGRSGRFERYLDLFRRRLLPLIHGRARIEALLAGGSPAACREFYAGHWDTWRWRLLFRAFFSRAVMARLGRDRACFAFAPHAIAELLLERARRALADPAVAANAYVHWLLTGEHAAALPFALRPGNFARIRANLDRLEWRCERLESWLARSASRSIDRFNLSNVFEYLPGESCDAMLRQVARVGRPDGRVLYWNLFAERERPADLGARLIPCRESAGELHARAATFFYRRLVLERIAA